MTQPWIRPTCALVLAAAWLVDLFTPQLFVVAILFNGPIALSSLALDSRFTQVLVAAALAADASAGYIDGTHDGYRWDTIAIADRVISGLSFLLVGGLSVATQRSAARAGELAARQARATRERSVRRAVEAIRRSVNPELVSRALVREAPESLGVDAAFFHAFDRTIGEPGAYVAHRGRSDVAVDCERPAAEVLSFVHRVAEGRERVAPVAGTDALGRLLLATLGARYAIAAPLLAGETVFGVLLLVRRDVPFETHDEEALAAYVDQAAIAFAQAALFVRLGQRNDELAVANAALSERGDVIRDIVYALSHDLRTPLAATRMTMMQARAGAYGALPQAYREILDRSLAANEELRRLAETLLLVARYESGEASTRRERADLSPLVRSVVDELEPLWREKGIAVDVTAPVGSCVDGDERELRRAVVNLIANAVTWTPANRRIGVALRHDDRRAVLVVEDEGYGVPVDERAALFSRLPATSRRPGAGSGLGLYLVRRIAERHGGSVAYAPRPGGGSTFVLALPRSGSGPCDG